VGSGQIESEVVDERHLDGRPDVRAASAGPQHVGARGATDLGGGWLRGCEHVASELLELGVNRVLLLTDGLANRGITSLEELEHHAAELRKRGVSTSTFGVAVRGRSWR
jgi:Mg-chelatase subunit ChlD